MINSMMEFGDIGDKILDGIAKIWKLRTKIDEVTIEQEVECTNSWRPYAFLFILDLPQESSHH